MPKGTPNPISHRRVRSRVEWEDSGGCLKRLTTSRQEEQTQDPRGSKARRV